MDLQTHVKIASEDIENRENELFVRIFFQKHRDKRHNSERN